MLVTQKYVYQIHKSFKNNLKHLTNIIKYNNPSLPNDDLMYRLAAKHYNYK